MPRRDKIRARWDETGSENEDSASYNISSRDIPSSKNEFAKSSLCQYEHEGTKTMLVQLHQQPSSEEESVYEEGDYNFPTFGKKEYICTDVVCFETGDGESNVDKESNKNIKALMATFLWSHIVANWYLLKSMVVNQQL